MTEEIVTTKLFGRLLRDYVRPHLGMLLVALGLMALAAAGTAGLAKLMEPILDEIFIGKSGDQLYFIASAIFLVFAVRGLATYGQTVAMSHVGLRIIERLQNQLCACLVRQEVAFFNDNPSATLVTRVTNDVQLMRSTVSNVITSLGKDSLTLIFLVAVMFWQDARLAVLAFFAFPLAVLPIARVGRRIRRNTHASQQDLGALSHLLTQIFQGIRSVKAYAAEQFELQRIAALTQRLRKLSVQSVRIRSALHPIMEMLGGAAIVLVIIYGGSQVINGTRSTGDFFSFITALLLAYEPVKKLANLNASLQEGMAAAARVFALIDRQPRLTTPAITVTPPPIQGQLSLEQVSFSYGNKPILQNFSWAVPARQTVALVGPSGAGKSTIFNLLLRLYDPTSGTVRLDGYDVTTLNPASLRQAIALVSQDSVLFDDSIAHNIAYGLPNMSREAIINAARLAHADDFIRTLPQGYETNVGEQGVKLSGGQRQRIALARAILKAAPILLLDEPTAALDSASEQAVQTALAELRRNHTCVIIAHRLSTVMHADRIDVLDNGQIIASGKHEQLYAQGGLYRQLCDLQFRQHDVATSV